MKRFIFFLMISIVLLFSSTSWNISEAVPAGKTITLKLQSDEHVWAYNADTPLLITTDQFSNNSSMNDGSAYENLIDNDKNTIFYSIWNTVMADANTTTGILHNLKTVIAVKNSGYVNVYTLDGKLLKRNVHVSEATKGLRKGIYLIGKQKILVR